MNSQQRRIVLWSSVGLAVFSFAMAFEVPVVESCMSCDRLFHHQHGPDVLVFRARHRTGKYSKEYLRTMAMRSQQRIEHNDREAKSKGLTFTQFADQNPPSIQEKWEHHVAAMLMTGAEPTEPVNLTLSLLAGVALPLLLLAIALFVNAGGRPKRAVVNE